MILIYGQTIFVHPMDVTLSTKVLATKQILIDAKATDDGWEAVVSGQQANIQFYREQGQSRPNETQKLWNTMVRSFCWHFLILRKRDRFAADRRD